MSTEDAQVSTSPRINAQFIFSRCDRVSWDYDFVLPEPMFWTGCHIASFYTMTEAGIEGMLEHKRVVQRHQLQKSDDAHLPFDIYILSSMLAVLTWILSFS